MVGIDEIYEYLELEYYEFNFYDKSEEMVTPGGFEPPTVRAEI